MEQLLTIRTALPTDKPFTLQGWTKLQGEHTRQHLSHYNKLARYTQTLACGISNGKLQRHMYKCKLGI
jgi:hypothetical protein